MLLCRLRGKSKRSAAAKCEQQGVAEGEVPSWSSAFSSELMRRQEQAITSFVSRLQSAVKARLPDAESAAPQQQQPAAPQPPLPPALQLDHGTLSHVFSYLLPRELATSKAVCREWNAAATSADMLRAMMRAWDLVALTGQPRCWSMVERTTIKHFVRKHVVCKSDSLAGLAVRFGTDLATLRRYNNITSDHTLQSRAHLFVPVLSASEVAGRSAAFVYDELSCREFVLLLPPPEPAEAAGGEGGEEGAKRAKGAQGDQAQGANAHAEAERLRRMARIMARSLKVDDATATYYLEEAGGDMRKAMRLAEQDAGWEVVASTEPWRQRSGSRRAR